MTERFSNRNSSQPHRFQCLDAGYIATFCAHELLDEGSQALVQLLLLTCRVY